jgi:hypothetical protein
MPVSTSDCNTELPGGVAPNFRLLFNGTPISYLILTPDFTTVAANEAACARPGSRTCAKNTISPNMVRSRVNSRSGIGSLSIRSAYLDAIHPDNLAAIKANIADSLATGKPWQYHFRPRHQDRAIQHIHARAKIDLDANGNPRVPGDSLAPVLRAARGPSGLAGFAETGNAISSNERKASCTFEQYKSTGTQKSNRTNLLREEYTRRVASLSFKN